jgi:hypothetical protein
MARGSKPGEGNRGGGRAKGKLNKATVERAALAERILAEQAGKPGQKLGREVLEEFMNMFGGIAGAFQPTPAVPGPITQNDLKVWAAGDDEPMFEKYSKLALKAATELADFQSPKFAPVHAPAPPPPSNKGPLKKKFTFAIFDGQGRPAPKHITVKPNSSVTSAAKN